MSEPFSGRSETIRKRGLASPPEKTWVQIEVGRAVPEDSGPATLTQAAPPPTATDAGAGVRLDDIRLVRARVDAVHEPGELVRRPDRPRADGDPGDADVERDRALAVRRPGVDTPDEAIERIRRPEVMGANSQRAEALDATGILCVILFVRGSILATAASPYSITQMPPSPAAIPTASTPFTRPTRLFVRGSIR